MLWLTEVQIQQKVEVTKIDASERLIHRLGDLGVQSGTVLEVLEHLPLGGPLVLQLADTTIAIRRGDAQCIQVRPLPI